MMIYSKKIIEKINLFLLLICVADTSFAKVFVDDTILTVIYDEEESIVITQKDLQRPNILGRPHTLQDLKLDALICRDARKLKVTIPDDVLNRMLEQIQKQNNISLEQFLEILKAENHTLTTYLEELKNMQLINSMLDFRVHSRATVSYENIMKYYNDHPIMQEERYQLRQCFVPFNNTKSIMKQKKDLLKQLHTGESFDWTDSFWVNSSDIDPSKDFIKSLHINKPLIQEEKEGFRIYLLVTKQKAMPIPLTERYEEIVKILKEPLEKELLHKYHQELLNNAIIIDF